MKINTKLGLWIAVVAGITTLSLASAAPVRTPKKAQAVKSETVDEAIDEQADVEAPVPKIHRKERSTYLFLGADLGISSYSAYNPAVEGARSGFDGGIRALMAFYIQKHWVIDTGFGWQFMSNSGTNIGGDQTKVSSKNFYFDLSPRYRFNKNWQLGPEFQYWLGTDVGLNPYSTTTDQPTADSNTSKWIGLQGMFEWTDSNKYRIGARYMTSLGVPQRTVNVIQIFFQIGLPLFGSNAISDEERPVRKFREQVSEGDLEKAEVYTPPEDPLPLATPEPVPEATPWAEMTPSATPEPTPAPEVIPTPKPRAQEKLVMTLDVNDLPFEFNNAHLPPYHSNRVKEVGHFLGEHKGAWRELVVSGHTDERGSNEYNNKLSLTRAQTVRQLLIKGGAPAARIKAVGYGKRKPIDKRHSEKAWTKNRRVELDFRGVKDVMLIRDALQRK